MPAFESRIDPSAEPFRANRAQMLPGDLIVSFEGSKVMSTGDMSPAAPSACP